MTPTRRSFLSSLVSAAAALGLCRFPAPVSAADSPRIPQRGDPYPCSTKLKLKGATCDGRSVSATYTLSWDRAKQAWIATVPCATCA